MRRRLFCLGAVLIFSVMTSAMTATMISAESVSEDETTAAVQEKETETIGEIETYEFTEESAPYEGTWIDLDEGFKLYVPTEWEIVSLSEQQKKEGILFQVLMPAEEEEPVPEILVKTEITGGETTLEGIGEKLNQTGYVYNGLVRMNDIPCAAYTANEGAQEDVVGIAFFDLTGEERLIKAEAHCFAEAPSELMTVLMSITP